MTNESINLPSDSRRLRHLKHVSTPLQKHTDQNEMASSYCNSLLRRWSRKRAAEKQDPFLLFPNVQRE